MESFHTREEIVMLRHYSKLVSELKTVNRYVEDTTVKLVIAKYDLAYKAQMATYDRYKNLHVRVLTNGSKRTSVSGVISGNFLPNSKGNIQCDIISDKDGRLIRAQLFNLELIDA